MIIATLSPDEREFIATMLQEDIRECLIAFDPIDRQFKFKIDGRTWSPPLGTFRSPDIASLRPWATGLRELIGQVVNATRP